MGCQRFETGLRAWLEAPEKGGHPLREFWIRDHLERVGFAQRLHLPLAGSAGLRAGSRVLDLGCGTAGTGVAFALAGHRVLGVDSSLHMLELAGLRAADEGAELRRVAGDGRRLPLCTSRFDLVVCDQVIEHVERYPELLEEAYRVLKPGGLLLLSAPHRLALHERHTDLLFAGWLPHWLAGRYAHLRGRRTPDEPWDVWLELPWRIRRRLGQAGFEEVRSPWRQLRRPPAEGSRIRRALARIGPLVHLVHWAFRWYGFLFGTVTFLLLKPGRPEEVS